MEVKVCVNGVPRIVCGITEQTTCQEVVVVLARALGQPGRYILREKFKDFERCMNPNEHILEILEKYGEQAKEVQLILQHNRPSGWDEAGRGKVGRYQPCPPLRRKEVSEKMRRGSGCLGLHRQSLPPLSSSRQEGEQTQEQAKKPKRKSLTLMEEAWGWLESLGKGKVYSTSGEKQSKKMEKSSRASLDWALFVEKENLDQSRRVGVQRGPKSDLEHRTSCCIGNQSREKESKTSKPLQVFSDLSSFSISKTEDEKNQLRETIVWQLSCLQNLQGQTTSVEREIFKLEEKQNAVIAETAAHETSVAEEMAQIKVWENELKAEQVYEKELQCHFHELKAKAAECKAQLEDYKRQMNRWDCSSSSAETSSGANTRTEASGGAPKRHGPQLSHSKSDAIANRKSPPGEDLNPPHADIPPHQIRERRPTGPTELREWWRRWSEAQTAPSPAQKAIHRSELTIYLSCTKV